MSNDYWYDKNHFGSKVQNTELERDKAAALGCSTDGRQGSAPRTRIRFIGYRTRPLDPDNFAGSVKALLDGLRYAHLIEGDEPWKIILETEQIKVRHRSEEKTVIELELRE